jgi:hypothetical protein
MIGAPKRETRVVLLVLPTETPAAGTMLLLVAAMSKRLENLVSTLITPVLETPTSKLYREASPLVPIMAKVKG